MTIQSAEGRADKHQKLTGQHEKSRLKRLSSSIFLQKGDINEIKQAGEGLDCTD